MTEDGPARADALTASIAATVRAARSEQALSVARLAERSGVSRAMITKIERGDAQPTAMLLGKLSGALGLTLSQLVARAENGAGDDLDRLRRRSAQPAWTDPQTGYVRRAVTAPGKPVEVVDVTLPGGASVDYPAQAYFRHHVLWLLTGRLDVLEGDVSHQLQPGDSLTLGPPLPCTYSNPGRRDCRYAVILTPRP